MEIKTIEIRVIEMTQAESNQLWRTDFEERKVCGKKVTHWHDSDGHNDILLEGEQTWYPVRIIG